MSTLSTTTEPEVACTLSEERQAQRRSELLGGLVQRIRRVRELSDGYAFGLALTRIDEASAREFVAFESRCCGFASFEVQRDEAEAAIWLVVRGPAGTKEFARQLVPASISIEAMPDPDGVCAEARGSAARLRGRRVLAPTRRSRTLQRAGIAGASAALVGILCCATPVLAAALGAIGLGAAVASARLWLDAAAIPLLVVSLLAVGVAFWRRRRAGQVSGLE